MFSLILSIAGLLVSGVLVMGGLFVLGMRRRWPALHREPALAVQRDVEVAAGGLHRAGFGVVAGCRLQRIDARARTLPLHRHRAEGEVGAADEVGCRRFRYALNTGGCKLLYSPM